MIDEIITLLLLVLLQAVLGIDNLLYISLESQNAPENKQRMVRTWGVGIAIILRIAFLFLLLHLIEYFQNPFLQFNWEGIVHADINMHSAIVLLGGGFIVFSSMKGIWNMISIEEHTAINKKSKQKSVAQVIVLIVLMNMVFSFDSILSAIALTHVFWVMATAIVISGVMMIFISGKVSEFLKKNRMYEVLGLFILFLVGVMLLSEGGHLAQLSFFDTHITPMNKTTFYFIIAILVLTDIIQSRYKVKLMKEKKG